MHTLTRTPPYYRSLALFFAAIFGFTLGQYLFKDCEAPLHEGEPVEVAGEPCCGG